MTITYPSCFLMRQILFNNIIHLTQDTGNVYDTYIKLKRNDFYKRNIWIGFAKQPVQVMHSARTRTGLASVQLIVLLLALEIPFIARARESYDLMT